MQYVLAAPRADRSSSSEIQSGNGKAGLGRPAAYAVTMLVATFAGIFGVWRANELYAPEMYHAAGPQQIAEALSHGENYAVFDLNINIRKLRDAHISLMAQPPELVVLGASHWQEAHVDLVPTRRFYNAHVHRDYYEDMLGMTEMFVRHGRMPRQMIIAIRDNLFTPIGDRTDHLWLPIVPYYQAMAERLGLQTHNALDMLPAKRWREQLSLDMLLSNAARWHHADVLPHATIEEQSENLDTLLPGGSIVWSKSHLRTFTPERAEREAAAFAARRVNDPPKIDPRGVEAIDALLGYLKAAGVEIFLVHPPFNPLFYDRVKAGPYIGGLRKVEELTRQLAHRHGARIIGSFNPREVGCDASMYIDAEHSNATCLGKLFQQYMQLDQPLRLSETTK